MPDELSLAAQARAERRRALMSLPSSFFNPVFEGLEMLQRGQNRKIDRLEAARIITQKIEGERNLRDAAIRVKTEEAQRERQEKGEKSRLVSEAMAGRIPLDEAVRHGDDEVTEAAARYEDMSQIPALDAESLQKYVPLTEPGRQLWQNRVASAEAEEKAALKEAAETEKEEAEEVAFSKIRTRLKGKKFTTLSEAVDFLESGDDPVPVPTTLFGKVKDYVVSERLGEDQAQRKKSAEALAERARRSLELAEKRLDLEERRFASATTEKEKADARAAADDARADLSVELRALEDIHGREGVYMGAEGKAQVQSVLDKVRKRAEPRKEGGPAPDAGAGKKDRLRALAQKVAAGKATAEEKAEFDRLSGE